MVKRVVVVGVSAVMLGMWVSLAAGAFLRPGVQPDGKSTGPVLSTDANGRIYLVWVDRRPGGPGLFFNRSDDGGVTWQDTDRPIYLSPSPEREIHEPEVWGDGLGSVYVVWRTRHPGDEIWFAVSWDFGATWRPAIRISSLGTGFLPRLSADRKGRIYVVWYEQLTRGRHYAVHFNTSWDRGKTWLSSALRLDPESPTGTAALPQLAADEAGRVYVVWREARGGPQEIVFVASSDAGKTWSTPVKLTRSNSHTEHPKVAVDGAGRVYVIWRDWRNGQRSDLYFTASTDHGKTWLPEAVRLNTNPPGSAEVYGPQLHASRQGYVYVTWMEPIHSQPDVFFTASADHGRTWLPPDRLSQLPASGRQAVLPNLTADEEGRVWVVWQEFGPTPKLFYSFSTDFGKTWLPREAPILPVDSTRRMHTPSLGVLPAGKLAVAWEERTPPRTFPQQMDLTRLPADVVVRQLTAPVTSP